MDTTVPEQTNPTESDTTKTTPVSARASTSSETVDIFPAQKTPDPLDRQSLDQQAIEDIRASLKDTPANSASVVQENTPTQIRHDISPVLPEATTAAEQPTSEPKQGILSKLMGLFSRKNSKSVSSPLPENIISLEEKRAQMRTIADQTILEETPQSEPATITHMQDYLHQKDVKNSLENAQKGGDWVPAEEVEKPA